MQNKFELGEIYDLISRVQIEPFSKLDCIVGFLYTHSDLSEQSIMLERIFEDLEEIKDLKDIVVEVSNTYYNENKDSKVTFHQFRFFDNISEIGKEVSRHIIYDMESYEPQMAYISISNNDNEPLKRYLIFWC